jgi:hypothetical protein
MRRNVAAVVWERVASSENANSTYFHILKIVNAYEKYLVVLF